MRNYMNLLLFSTMIFFALTSSAPLYARDFIIVGGPKAPFNIKEGNKLSGINVEIIGLIMKELGIPYKIRLMESTARMEQEAKKGTIDMIISKSKKKSRMDFLIYPEEAYKVQSWNFFIRKIDENKIQFDTFDDLKGLKIGATKSYAYTEEFWNANLNLELVSKDELQIKKLLKKRIDAVPMNTLATLYQTKTNGTLQHITYLPKPIKIKKYYSPFAKASTYPNKEALIVQYDQVLKKLKKSGAVQAIFDKYLKD